MPGINEINLIPNEIIEERLIRRRIKRWGIFLVSLAAGLFLVRAFGGGYHSRLQKELTALRTYDRKVKSLETELTDGYQSVKQLLEEREILLRLTDRYGFTPVISNLAEDLDPQTKLTRLWIEKGKASEEKAEADIFCTLRVWGMSKSYQNLSHFLLNLQNDSFFREVTLVRSDTDDKQKSLVVFEISLNCYGNREQRLRDEGQSSI